MCIFLPVLRQVLAGGAGPEAAAAAGGLLQGAGDLAGVSGRGSAEFHQPGLPQLRAHQPEPQRPGPIQLRGRSGERQGLIQSGFASTLRNALSVSSFPHGYGM